jgi:hypothetical protein
MDEEKSGFGDERSSEGDIASSLMAVRLRRTQYMSMSSALMSDRPLSLDNFVLY